MNTWQCGRAISWKSFEGGSGADEQTRTADLRITNALLYQLSYIGTIATVWRFLSAGATIGPDAKRRKNQAFEKY
jgi:hypothetical protein